MKLHELCAGLCRDAAATAHGPCDAAVLRSLPGVGAVTLATLLTEAGDPLARRDHAALRTLSGVAPVTKRSGKTCIVVMRYAAQVRLRQAVFHWARVAVLNDPKCRGRYEALRARPLLRPGPARRRRPAARGRLRLAAAAGPVRPRSRQVGGNLTQTPSFGSTEADILPS